MKDNKAICAGCGKTASECGLDGSEDNRVEIDGTYDKESNQFVCDGCYIGLTIRGLDVGSPKQLIKNIREVRKEFDRKQKIKRYNVLDTNASKWDVKYD